MPAFPFALTASTRARATSFPVTNHRFVSRGKGRGKGRAKKAKKVTNLRFVRQSKSFFQKNQS